MLWLILPVQVLAQDEATALNDYLTEEMRRSGTPGMAVTVVRPGKPVYVQGFGIDGNGRPVTADTPFFAGSLSKSFTALAVMQLVEAGRIELDRPASLYLPEFRIGDPRGLKITVRQLLSQTSGMADKTFFEWDAPGPASLEGAVVRMRSAGLSADPGTRFLYHNPNYHVAARLVEVVSGTLYRDYMKAHIFRPLKMHHTYVIDRPGDAAVPSGHIFGFGEPFAVRQPDFFINGAGGVVTTASDMAKWLMFQARWTAQQQGVPILGDSGLAATHARQPGAGSYGLGWFVRGEPGAARVTHAGWLPTFTAYQSVDEKSGQGIAVLRNVGAIDGAYSGGAAAVGQGIDSILNGRAPSSPGPRIGRFVDGFLAAMALLAAWRGWRAIRRRRAWAGRVGQLSAWRKARAFMPRLAALGIIASVPHLIALAVPDRAASWLWLFYLTPVLVMLLAWTAIVSMAVLAARVLALRADDC